MHRTLIIITIFAVILICGCSNNQKSDTTVLTPGITDDSQEAITNYLSEDPERQTDCWWFPVSKPGADPIEGPAPLSVHFYDNGSYSPRGYPIIKWFWKFQKTDRWWEGWKDYTSTKGDANFIYEQPGNYTATLLVMDRRHWIGIGHITITVTESIPSSGWARTWGGSGAGGDWANTVAVDTNGNVYVAGQFSSTVDFDPGLGEDWHTANGICSPFLSKFDSAGTFQWANTWGNENANGVESAVTDSENNIYVFSYDSINKFDSNGNQSWAINWGGTYPRGMAICNQNVLCLTGWFQGGIDFDPGPEVDMHWGSGYLSRFDLDGNYLGAGAWDGLGLDVAADNRGSIYVTGYFNNTIDFDPGPGIDLRTSVEGSGDAYLSKFDSNGIYEWVLTWGGPAGEEGNGVAIDNLGNVCVVGCFSGDLVDFDPGPGIDEHSSYPDRRTMFLSKFDDQGNFQWAGTWGGSYSIGAYGDIAIDNWDNIYITDMFVGVVDFDPGDGVDNGPGYRYYDSFLSKFSPDGTYQWVRTWGTSSPYEWGRGVAVNSLGSIYATGRFGPGTADFAPHTASCITDPDNHSSAGLSDAYLVKFLPDGCW